MDDETVPTAADDEGVPVSVAALLRREGYEPHPDLELGPTAVGYERPAPVDLDRPRRTRRLLIGAAAAVACGAVLTVALVIGSTGRSTPSGSAQPAIGAPVAPPTASATPEPTPAAAADSPEETSTVPAPRATAEKTVQAPVVAPQVQVVTPVEQAPVEQQQAPSSSTDEDRGGSSTPAESKSEPTKPADSGKQQDDRTDDSGSSGGRGGLLGLVDTLLGG